MKSVMQNNDTHTNGTREAHKEQYLTPEVNIFQSGDGYVLEAEMPGVAKEGLEITLEDNELTIVGRRNWQELSGEPLVQECARASYRRVFGLDPAIEFSKIVARMEQGILTLTLPKSERVKPRKINVE